MASSPPMTLFSGVVIFDSTTLAGLGTATRLTRFQPGALEYNDIAEPFITDRVNRHYAGLPDHTIEMEGLFAPDSALAEAALATVSRESTETEEQNAVVQVDWRLEDGTRSTSNPEYTSNYVVTSFHEFGGDGQAGAPVRFSATLSIHSTGPYTKVTSSTA